MNNSSKNKLIECINFTADELGLTTGEFKNYSENRLSIDKKLYKSVKYYWIKLYKLENNDKS